MASAGVYGFRLEGRGRLGIEGIKEVNKQLKNLSDATRLELKETHRQAGNIVIRAAQRFVPIRSGALAHAMRSNPTLRMGRIRLNGDNLPYAGPIHFGWPARRIAPQPYVYDALDSRRNEVLHVYEQRIGELIRKYAS